MSDIFAQHYADVPLLGCVVASRLCGTWLGPSEDLGNVIVPLKTMSESQSMLAIEPHHPTK